jgi:lysyl endopeptidase
MQLRVDGTLVSLSASPINLGGGNTLAKASSGSGLDITISDGTAFTVTPLFWATEGYWYLDIYV